ncbi:MAG: ribonuclease P protein component [Candidatus Niyogibacteria bacterium]|nr:ribonuclease P protein component [Candidatus Niyogibacteria bacterium]
MRSPDVYSRLAVIVPKTTDKRATVRNAMRRRVTETMRPILPHLSPPVDIAITVIVGAKTPDFQELKRIHF